MTRKLYWKSDITETEVEVLECKQVADGRYGLLLDATPLFVGYRALAMPLTFWS